MSSKTNLVIISAVTGLFGLAGWAAYGYAFHDMLGQDWIVFWSAVQAYHDGNLPLIFDGERLTAAMNARFASWLGRPLDLHPWIYPPNFLLLLLPFGRFPFGIGYVLFQAITFALAAAVLWHKARNARERWLHGFALLLYPAVPFAVLTGQNSFLTAALLVGGIAFMERRPILAGALLGILSYKPQFCLMVPVALLAAREWRVMVTAGATAALVALASLALFGADAWRAWIEFVSGADPNYRTWIVAGRLNGISVYASVMALGVSEGLANAAQSVAMLLAAASVYWSFRRPMPQELRLAILLTATILAAPHVSDSDAVLLGIAITFVLTAALADGFRRGDAALIMALWLCPLLNPPSAFKSGVVTPLLLVWLILSVIARAHRSAPSPPRGGVLDLALR